MLHLTYGVVLDDNAFGFQIVIVAETTRRGERWSSYVQFLDRIDFSHIDCILETTYPEAIFRRYTNLFWPLKAHRKRTGALGITVAGPELVATGIAETPRM